MILNTHQGLYHYTWLPFGVAAAPAKCSWIRSILVTESDDDEHLHNLEEVFMELKKHGFRLKKQKCQFLTLTLEYLGHQINCNGLRAVLNKIEAIVKGSQATSVQELSSWNW